MRMLRNFGILKIRLWRPTRSDQYKTGPDEVRRTIIATSAIGKARTSASSKAKDKSNRRFISAGFQTEHRSQDQDHSKPQNLPFLRKTSAQDAFVRGIRGHWLLAFEIDGSALRSALIRLDTFFPQTWPPPSSIPFVINKITAKINA